MDFVPVKQNISLQEVDNKHFVLLFSSMSKLPLYNKRYFLHI